MKSLGMSILVCPAALYVASLFFGYYYFYMPLAAVLVVALAAAWFRIRGLRSGLPEPYGRGKASTTDAKGAARVGLLIVLGGVLCTVVLLGSAYFLPPPVLFALVFGLAAGLPLNEIVFFILVTRYERISESRIFLVTEEVEDAGKSALVKTFELGYSPASRRESPRQ